MCQHVPTTLGGNQLSQLCCIDLAASMLQYSRPTDVLASMKLFYGDQVASDSEPVLSWSVWLLKGLGENRSSG